MSPQITVDDVGPPREYPSNYGTLVAYLLTFSGNDAQGSGEISQKPESKPPQVGETLDVEISPGRVKDEESGERWPNRLKRVKAEGAVGASNAKGSSGGGFVRDKGEAARIVRQHSQEMALMHVAAMERRGAAKNEAFPVDFDLAKLKAIIDWYQRDAENAKPLGDQS